MSDEHICFAFDTFLFYELCKAALKQLVAYTPLYKHNSKSQKHIYALNVVPTIH